MMYDATTNRSAHNDRQRVAVALVVVSAMLAAGCQRGGSLALTAADPLMDSGYTVIPELYRTARGDPKPRCFCGRTYIEHESYEDRLVEGELTLIDLVY